MNEQPSSVRAAIAIGRNTIRLVIARSTPDDLDIVVDREEPVHIGESATATGASSQEKTNAAIAVLKRYKGQARRRQADLVLVVATEASSQASNSTAFLEQVQRETKLAVYSISGTAGAALTFLGATYEVKEESAHLAHIGVMDSDGESLELVTVSNKRITWRTFMPIGAGWLHDRFLSSDPPGYDEEAIAGAFLKTYVQGMRLKYRPSVLIVTGGSATSLLSLAQQAFPLEEHQTHLTHQDLISCQGLLSSLSSEELAQRYHLEVGRARLLLAEALILQAVMSRLHIAEIIISSHGLPEGVLLAYERYGERWVDVAGLDATLTHVPQAGVSVALAAEEEPFVRSGRRKLKQRTRKLLELPDEVLKGEDVQAVHKMRVASRRLRATLDAYQYVTGKERHEIACIARYHRRALPSVSHEEFAALSVAARARVSALAALLRIADALDWSHEGRVLQLAANKELCDDRIWTISLWRRSPADLDAELEHAYEKADLFEKVFGRKLHLLVQDQE